jgi:hypothetical protein
MWDETKLVPPIGGAAAAMLSDVAVDSFENAMSGRNLAEPSERLGPPDLAGEEEDGVGSAEDLASDREHFYLLERIGGIEAELTLHPRSLERDEFESAGTKETATALRGGHAIAALTIVENPAAAPHWRSIASFCLFC